MIIGKDGGKIRRSAPKRFRNKQREIAIHYRRNHGGRNHVQEFSLPALGTTHHSPLTLLFQQIRILQRRENRA